MIVKLLLHRSNRHVKENMKLVEALLRSENGSPMHYNTRVKVNNLTSWLKHDFISFPKTRR